MTDEELLRLRTAALQRTTARLDWVHELARDAKARGALLDPDVILEPTTP